MSIPISGYLLASIELKNKSMLQSIYVQADNKRNKNSIHLAITSFPKSSFGEWSNLYKYHKHSLFEFTP
ncbi:MAG: hypothetical protein WKF85_13935 [Chitinophagaceae bacterium]